MHITFNEIKLHLHNIKLPFYVFNTQFNFEFLDAIVKLSFESLVIVKIALQNCNRFVKGF